MNPADQLEQTPPAVGMKRFEFRIAPTVDFVLASNTFSFAGASEAVNVSPSGSGQGMSCRGDLGKPECAVAASVSAKTMTDARCVPGLPPAGNWIVALPCLSTSMVVSIETEYLHPDAGHVKLEDTIVVTPSGHEGLGDVAREWCTVPEA